MTAADTISEKIESGAKSPKSGRAAMKTTPPTPFVKLRKVAAACIAMLDPHGTARPVSVIIKLDTGEEWPVPLPKPPRIGAIGRAIISAVKRAGGPLQQKEIAAATHLSIRTVSRNTPILVKRKYLRRHPTQGFYLPGMVVEE